jgi:transcriptional antiterminator RfaH
MVKSEQFEWLALQVKPREEKRAKENLSNQGFEPYFPIIYSLTIKNKNKVIKEEPMFPGYAFVRFSKNMSLKQLDSTRGIIEIVKFGNEYPVLDQQIISSIQDIEHHSLKSPKKQTYKIGDKIIINNGPLKHQKAIIAGKVSNQRIEILYTLLNRAHLIQVNVNNISKS